MKTCSLCNLSKALQEFSKCSAREDGLQNYCKPCAKEKRRERYLAKIDEEREQNRQWHIENKPWLDPAKREYLNAWRRASDRQTEKNNRRALEMNAEGSFTTEEWYSLCETFGNKCLSCGRPDVKLTQDHVVPLSKGGTNWITNIQPLCGTCNSSKGAKTIDYRLEVAQ
jgi:5-methylcytosine-specific restriction endonuclease McrA